MTLKRNTESFEKCDLVPDILASVGEPDMTTEVFGKKIKIPPSNLGSKANATPPKESPTANQTLQPTVSLRINAARISVITG